MQLRNRTRLWNFTTTTTQLLRKRAPESMRNKPSCLTLEFRVLNNQRTCCLGPDFSDPTTGRGYTEQLSGPFKMALPPIRTNIGTRKPYVKRITRAGAHSSLICLTLGSFSFPGPTKVHSWKATAPIAKFDRAIKERVLLHSTRHRR